MSLKSQARKYVASLTGLRGIAAFAVFLFHYEALHPGIRLDLDVPVVGAVLQFPLGFGFAGVDLFFVLSGFLLTLPFAMACLRGTGYPRFGTYFKRRLLRVFPAYYGQLLLILAAGSWFVTWRDLDGAGLLAHLTMFFNIGWHPVRPLVGLWWTLPVELSFYLLLPIIAPLMKPVRWGFLLLGGIVISMVYRSWAAIHFTSSPGDSAFLAASQLPGSLPEFLLGASAALLVQMIEVRSLPRPTPNMLDLMFLLGLVGAVLWLGKVVFRYGDIYWSGHWSMVIAPLVLGLTLSLIVISLYWGSRLGQVLFANPVVYFLGLVSYSLYLWHFVVMQQTRQLLGESYESLSGVGQFLLATVLVIGVSTASYYLLERPFFRLRQGRKV